MTDPRQSVLDYARPIRRVPNPLIESASDGFVLLRLPEPPLRLEALRLAGMLLVLALILLAMAVMPFVWGNRSRAIMAGVAGLLVLGSVGVAVGMGAWEQAAIVYRRLKLPSGAEHAIRLSSHREATTDPPGTLAVTSVMMEVEDSRLPFGNRARVSVTTRSGRSVHLLIGHPPEVLRTLVADLREALFPGKKKPTANGTPA